MTLVYKNCDGAVPKEIGPLTEEDEQLLATAASLCQVTGEAISNQAIHKYVEAMVSMVWDANKYIDVQAPWVLKKTDQERMKTVLYVLMEVMRHVAILYQPLMPTSSNAILDQLAVPDDEREFEHLGKEECKILLGREVSKPTAVFPRFEVPVAA
jgi:methionyl-tRNA synthetase